MTILPIRPNTGSTLPKQACHDLSRSLSRWLMEPTTQQSGTDGGAALVEVAS